MTPEEFRAYNRAKANRFYQRNKEAICSHKRDNYDADAQAVAFRKSHLKRTYGMTPEDYDVILAAQGGGCGICGLKSNRGKRFVFDHDHETGRVRGLLCSRCNLALGAFNDDPELLHRAAWFLDQVETALALAERAASGPPSQE